MDGIKTTLGSIDPKLLLTIKEEMRGNAEAKKLLTGEDFPLVYFLPTHRKHRELWNGLGLSQETQTKLGGIMDEFEKHNKSIQKMKFPQGKEYLKQAILDVLDKRCGIMSDEATLANLYFNLSKGRITIRDFVELGHPTTSSDLDELL